MFVRAFYLGGRESAVNFAQEADGERAAISTVHDADDIYYMPLLWLEGAGPARARPSPNPLPPPGRGGESVSRSQIFSAYEKTPRRSSDGLSVV